MMSSCGSFPTAECYSWFVSFEMPWSVFDPKCILVNAAQLVFFGDVSRVIHIPAVVAVSTSGASSLLLLNCDVVEDCFF